MRRWRDLHEQAAFLGTVAKRLIDPLLDFSRRHRRDILLALVFAVIVGFAVDPAVKTINQKIEERALRNIVRAVALVTALDKNMQTVGQGSGVFIRPNGVLVTNQRVVSGSAIRSIEAKLPTGAIYRWKGVLGEDKDSDLALLQFEAQDVPFVDLGDSDIIESGQRLLVISSSLGLGTAVTEARVSYREKESIQFVAAIPSSSSGGGLVGNQYSLVGVIRGAVEAAAGKSTAPLQNLYSAVPANLIKAALQGHEPTFTVKSPEYFYLQGILAENKHEYDKAIDHFAKATQLDPSFADAYIQLGYVYFLKGKFDLQLKAYENAVKVDPKNPDTWTSLGGAYEDLGLYDKAIAAYRKGLEIEPDDRDTIHELGILYIARGDRTRAVEMLMRLSKLDTGLANELKALLSRLK
jgi:tetratricopeptide (TPR) repeat protein